MDWFMRRRVGWIGKREKSRIDWVKKRGVGFVV